MRSPSEQGPPWGSDSEQAIIPGRETGLQCLHLSLPVSHVAVSTTVQSGLESLRTVQVACKLGAPSVFVLL